MAKQVDTIYGNALFELALEENKMDDFYQEVTTLIEVIEENSELITLFGHPKLSKEEKSSVIEQTFQGRISSEIVGLIAMVVEKGHAAKLLDVFKFFIKLVKAKKKIGVASVVSAVTLTEDKKAAIEKRLIETTEYETMEVDYSVDESIIGGLVIRIGDRIVDSSIKTKLTNLSKSLAQ